MGPGHTSGWAGADLPEASSRATVLLSKVIRHQQVIAAPSPGAVCVMPQDDASAAAVARWQSLLVHRGGDLGWRISSRSLWASDHVCAMTLSLSPSLTRSLTHSLSLSAWERMHSEVPQYLYLLDTLNFTDVEGSPSVMTEHTEGYWW